MMRTRRSVLRALCQAPLLGAAASSHAKAIQGKTETVGPSLYDELAVPRFINAGEPFTILGGAPVRPEVKAAMSLAGGKFVTFSNAQNAIGAHLAKLLGSEAAMVTAGAAGALTLGTAACMTGKDKTKIYRLPDSSGMRNEVIIQKAHRYSYEQSVRACGAKMVEIETSEQLRTAIGPATAMLLFNNRWTHQGQIKHEEFVQIGKAHGVPTFIDCAADAPPAENLTRFNALGFDLVTFSGSKGLRAPSSTGLLMGRGELIEAANHNGMPYDLTIGRGMKVSRDELVGLAVAVELCLQEKTNSIFTASEATLRRMADELNRLPGVRAEIFSPPVSYSWPHLRIRWDESRPKMSADDVRGRLWAGTPSIETRTGPDDVEGLEISAWMLSDEEVPIVVRRISEAITA
jgi:uncharacterized pyridoxal phosphate-dependent enzyme